MWDVVLKNTFFLGSSFHLKCFGVKLFDLSIGKRPWIPEDQMTNEGHSAAEKAMWRKMDIRKHNVIGSYGYRLPPLSGDE